MSQRINNTVFYDEEDCLGFGVFVAELELIVGTSRDRRPDQIQLLELLQKLQASISTADATVLKQHQKRCEAALYDIMYKGGSAVVGVLVCMACQLFSGQIGAPVPSSVTVLLLQACWPHVCSQHLLQHATCVSGSYWQQQVAGLLLRVTL